MKNHILKAMYIRKKGCGAKSFKHWKRSKADPLFFQNKSSMLYTNCELQEFEVSKFQEELEHYELLEIPSFLK